MGFIEATRWIRIGRTHHFGIRNQRGPLIVNCFDPSDHSGDSEFVSPECKPKSLVTLTPESREGLLSVEFQDFCNSGFGISEILMTRSQGPLH
jgi:hypothetical protein